MSFSNYEQTVIINGVSLSGVQDVNGSYGISEKPIRVAGVGFVDALIDSPLEGNFTITRKMVSSDPLLASNALGSYDFDEQEISGAILYDDAQKGFGFTRGRVSRYAVSCSVGEIPTIETEVRVFGQLGASVLNNDLINPHPPIQFPDQSSIKVKVSDFEIDAISDFSFSRTLNLSPIYAIHQGDSQDWENGKSSLPNLEPVQIDTQYPIETDINFTMIAQSYQIREIKDRIQSAPKSDVSIEIRDSKTNEMISHLVGENVRLISESITSSVAEEMSISLTYKGYEASHNPVS